MPITRPSQFRLPEETLSQIDQLATRLGLASKTAVVRMAVAALHRTAVAALHRTEIPAVSQAETPRKKSRKISA